MKHTLNRLVVFFFFFFSRRPCILVIICRQEMQRRMSESQFLRHINLEHMHCSSCTPSGSMNTISTGDGAAATICLSNCCGTPPTRVPFTILSSNPSFMPGHFAAIPKASSTRRKPDECSRLRSTTAAWSVQLLSRKNTVQERRTT